MFARLGTWCHDHRRLVLDPLDRRSCSSSNGVAGGVGDAYPQDFNLPDVESRGLRPPRRGVRRPGHRLHRDDRLRGRAGRRRPRGRRRPWRRCSPRSPSSTTSPRCRAPTTRVASQLIASQGPRPAGSPTPTSSCPRTSTSPGPARSATRSSTSSPEIDGLRIELGGFLFAEFEQPSSELIGLAFAIVILIVAFGSVLAMGLPVGVALFGIGIGGALVDARSATSWQSPTSPPSSAIMIGLGVGIDYALLIVTRYREQLHDGHDVRESVTIAMDTAGRSVLFAGTTVVISLLGMLLMGVGFVAGPGRRAPRSRSPSPCSPRSPCCRRCSASPASASSAPAGAASSPPGSWPSPSSASGLEHRPPLIVGLPAGRWSC